jgi:uncharacterized protein (TIGR00369 family)
MDDATAHKPPFANLLGIEIEHAGRGQARLRLPFRPELRNRRGARATIHGGAIASLIDTAAAVALFSEPIEHGATISMSINYLSAGGERDLLASARVRRRGRTIASINVEVHDEADNLIADAILTFRVA